ncbi:MAG: HAD family phosphatase [Lachnospiraceae bacterium]|nr:HAD family phosphatase [Lachnospiraceae bacterium]
MVDYKGVIFDFNGTLFFDNDKHILAWNEVSRMIRGRDITEQELHEKFNGTPNEQIIRYMTNGKAAPGEINRYSLLKEELYRKYCKEDKNTFHLVDGAVNYFHWLQRRQIPFTIASASIRENMDFFRESFDLDRYIEPSKLVYDNGSYENKVQMFQDAAVKLGVDMKDILIIEDSLSGIVNAYAAGCDKILVICEKCREKEYSMYPGVIGTMQTFEHIYDFF